MRSPQNRIEGTFPASSAFELYDTYGFPLDLTQVMARERGLSVDVDGFEKLMEEQRERGRAAQKKTVVAAGEEDSVATEFVGFEMDHSKATVVDLRTGPKGETFALVDRSPLYAEMGGQVGDTGLLILKDEKIPVTDTIKRGQTFYLKLATPAPIRHPQSAIRNSPSRRTAPPRDRGASHRDASAALGAA